MGAGHMDRRQLFQGLAATGFVAGGLTLQASGPVRADGTMPMRAFHQFSVGDIAITIIDDGSFNMPTGMFGANAPRGAVADLFGSYGLHRDMAEITLQIMLVETAGVKLLIDAGTGEAMGHGGDGSPGRLGQSLAALGLAASDIDIMLITHGHPDHVGGLTTLGEQSFVNAQHYLPEVEFAFWTQDPANAPVQMREMITLCRSHILPVSHGIRSYADGDEIAPGVFAVAAPGHTHGHFAVRIESQGASLLHLVDTSVHFIAGLERPDWTLGADLDKPLAVETRKRLLAQVASEQTMIAGYHFPFPGVGRIVPLGDGYRFVPMPLA